MFFSQVDWIVIIQTVLSVKTSSGSTLANRVKQRDSSLIATAVPPTFYIFGVVQRLFCVVQEEIPRLSHVSPTSSLSLRNESLECSKNITITLKTPLAASSISVRSRGLWSSLIYIFYSVTCFSLITFGRCIFRLCVLWDEGSSLSDDTLNAVFPTMRWMRFTRLHGAGAESLMFTQRHCRHCTCAQRYAP